MKFISMLVLFVAQVALAQPQGGPPGQNQGQGPSQGQSMGQNNQGMRKPPKEAIEACSGKSANDACSFTGRNNKALNGTCFRPKEDVPFACRPSNHKDKKH